MSVSHDTVEEKTTLRFRFKQVIWFTSFGIALFAALQHRAQSLSKFNQLIKDMKSRGAEFANIYRSQNGIHGLFTSEALKRGDIVMKIPYGEFLLLNQCGDEQDEKMKQFDYVPTCTLKNAFEENIPKFKAYFEMLHESIPSYKTHPATYPREVVEGCKEILHEEYTNAKEEIDMFQIWTWTREWELEDDVYAMIPVAGLINHIDESLKNIDEEWDEENQFYIIYAYENIPAKSELRFHYFEPNEKSNLETLNDFGFVQDFTEKKTEPLDAETCAKLKKSCFNVEGSRYEPLRALSKELCGDETQVVDNGN